MRLKPQNDSDLNHLFSFIKNGEIKVRQRVHGSDDLEFLEHIRSGQYVKPKIHSEGTLPCSRSGIEQSNKLAKDVITESEAILTPTATGYRIEPLTENVFINGERISGVKELSLGDFVNLKEIGFQIL